MIIMKAAIDIASQLVRSLYLHGISGLFITLYSWRKIRHQAASAPPIHSNAADIGLRNETKKRHEIQHIIYIRSPKLFLPFATRIPAILTGDNNVPRAALPLLEWPVDRNNYVAPRALDACAATENFGPVKSTEYRTTRGKSVKKNPAGFA
jgi:hypothetical protein